MDPEIQAETLIKIMAQFDVASEPLPEVNIQYQTTQNTKAEGPIKASSETLTPTSSEKASDSESKTVIIPRIKHETKYQKRPDFTKLSWPTAPPTRALPYCFNYHCLLH